MSVEPNDLWHWLLLVQHELLLFAGVFFLIGALDDLCLDAVYGWLRLRRRAGTPTRERAELTARALTGPAAVFIPAWSEAEVIGNTLARMLAAWPQSDLVIYVGCYRNDAATLAAVMAAAQADCRVRLVIHTQDGPTTKADCLNRLYRALCADERRIGCEYAMVVFHDAEDMVDPAALGLLDEAIAGGSDFVQLPVEPLVQRHRSWFNNHLGSHYCEEFAETNWSLSQRARRCALHDVMIRDLDHDVHSSRSCHRHRRLPASASPAAPLRARWRHGLVAGGENPHRRYRYA